MILRRKLTDADLLSGKLRGHEAIPSANAEEPPPAPPDNVILMEDNTGWLLMEDGSDILLE